MGSEMCIRDSFLAAASRGLVAAKKRGGTFAGAALRGFWAAFS